LTGEDDARRAAQDPGEPFDLCDDRGAPLGRTKARALVHRDGDWHRSVHLWVLLEGGLRVLLQRRSPHKDTWPGAIDVAVAGHLAAGEALEAAMREADEEIGLAARPGDFVRLGTRRRVDASQPGVIDREIQDILAIRTERRLEELRPSEGEVAALYGVDQDEAIALLTGRADRVAAARLAPGGARAIEGHVARGELVAAPDGYYDAVASSLAALALGRTPEPFWIG
jgi:isopentenyldiphosphate isomerase